MKRMKMGGWIALEWISLVIAIFGFVWVLRLTLLYLTGINLGSFGFSVSGAFGVVMLLVALTALVLRITCSIKNISVNRVMSVVTGAFTYWMSIITLLCLGAYMAAALRDLEPDFMWMLWIFLIVIRMISILVLLITVLRLIWVLINRKKPEANKAEPRQEDKPSPSFENLLYMQKEKGAKYMQYVTRDGVQRVRRTLSEAMELVVDQPMILIDRGCAVNLNQVVRLEENILTMSDGQELVVGQQRLDAVRAAIIK